MFFFLFSFNQQSTNYVAWLLESIESHSEAKYWANENIDSGEICFIIIHNTKSSDAWCAVCAEWRHAVIIHILFLLCIVKANVCRLGVFNVYSLGSSFFLFFNPNANKHAMCLLFWMHCQYNTTIHTTVGRYSIDVVWMGPLRASSSIVIVSIYVQSCALRAFSMRT